ncbi:MAG: cysteine desulfurase [Clostridioides sp.]|jgi:cysteine desulfurase|nr:cysteine desulfurase [Clostridioides sp.]
MEIYLDNSATTKPYKEVIESMVEALENDFANPSAAHSKGVAVERKIKKIRQLISRKIGIDEKEIFFTSGGTECNNTIIKGVANYNKKRKNHIISTKIEHPSVLNTLSELETEGFEVTYLDVDSNGIINLEDFKNSLKPNTCLVSIMHVNNEIGSVQPVEQIGKLLKCLNEKVYFHIDAVQSFGKIDFKPSQIGVDFMSVSGHKFHGPKGIGFMYIKKDSKIKPFLHGGGQERGFRSGTENVPGIYGIGKATEVLFEDLNSNIEKMKSLRELLKSQIEKNIDNIKINSTEDGVCHILNVSFLDVKGEVLLHFLEQKGIYVSTGSACSSKKKGSHVLNAIGLSQDEIDGAIRFSLSELNTEEEILKAVDVLKDSVNQIRNIMKR